MKNFLSRFFNANAGKAIPEKGYAFVSYSRTNAAMAEMFASYPIRVEIPPWVDNQIAYGEIWEMVILERIRIRNCKMFLLMMSPEAEQSTFVQKKSDLLISTKNMIIPVLFSGEPFERLRNFQHFGYAILPKDKCVFVERLWDLLTQARFRVCNYKGAG